MVFPKVILSSGISFLIYQGGWPYVNELYKFLESLALRIRMEFLPLTDQFAYQSVYFLIFFRALNCFRVCSEPVRTKLKVYYQWNFRQDSIYLWDSRG